ncbi:SGNH/GDSL hydrolase family protein [Okibacterium endophyticum]
MSSDSGLTFEYSAAAFLHGHLDTVDVGEGFERAHRATHRVQRIIADAKFGIVSERASGVRLTLQSRATSLSLTLRETVYVLGDAAVPPPGEFDVYVDGELFQSLVGPLPTVSRLDSSGPDGDTGASPAAELEVRGLPDELKRVDIWFPTQSAIDVKTLRADADVHTVRRSPALAAYGSSITQGVGVTRPSLAWPARVARELDLDLWNLGMGGSAQLDPSMATLIRDTPLDLRLLVLEVGINIVTTNSMSERVFRSLLGSFIDVIRERHQQTTIVLISPLGCPIHETDPGPTITIGHDATGQPLFGATGSEHATGLTLRHVREITREVYEDRARDDAHLTYVDGLELLPLDAVTQVSVPDNLHPGEQAHGDIARALLRGLQMR